MPARNIAAEKQMVDTFIKTRGRLPKDSQDWATVMKMAYPTNELPDELKNSEAASLYSAGFAKPAPVAAPTLPTNVTQPGDTYGNSLVQQTNQAKADSDKAFSTYDSMPSGNEALRILQEAIKTKAAPRDFRSAGIGESEIFKQAGVGGFGALAQSLNTRGQELEMNRADFANTISQMADVYKTNATSALERYNKALDQYKFTAQLLDSHMQDLQRNEQQIKIIQLQNRLDKELRSIDFQNNLALKRTPDIGEQTNILQNGYELNNGVVTDPSKGIVAGFNIGRYATDPNHERAVASIIQNIGQFNTLNDVQAYISKKYPNSPVTADMISKASEKYGVPWEMLVAMMEQDSSLGTQGKGARTFNPGNVGNDDAGNIKNYGTWQAGVDAVANWLSKNRVSSTSSSNKFTPQFYATPEGQKVRDDERALQGMYLANQTVKDYQVVQSQFQSMQNVISSGIGGPGDLDLVYSFMKGLDPNSVVRETEFATAAKSGNIFSGAFAKYNGYLKDSGGFLPENVKKAFVALVKNKMEVKKALADDFRSKIKEQAARQGLNPENVTIDFTLPNEPQDAGSTPSSSNSAIGDLNFKL